MSTLARMHSVGRVQVSVGWKTRRRTLLCTTGSTAAAAVAAAAAAAAGVDFAKQ